MRTAAFCLACIAISLCTFADVLPGDAPLTQEHPNLPNGFALVARFDGQNQLDRRVNGAPRITLKKGTVNRLENLPSGLACEIRDEQQVVFECAGMNPAAQYVLGFAWCSDEAERRVSVSVGNRGDVVLSKVKPAAFHADKPTYARVQIPLTPNDILNNKMQVTFTRDSGSAASVNEVWLLQRQDTAPRPRVLIVTGDDYAGHLWRATGPALAGILREDPRLEVSITECPAILASPQLFFYDAVVLHFKNYSERMPLGQEVWTGLEQFLAAGKGVTLVHFGCGAFQEWNGFVNVAGRIWDPAKRGHDPYGEFQMRVTKPEHLITAGLSNFTTQDELYTCLVGSAPIDVVCEATSHVDQMVYPMAFVVPREKGRVFQCTLGHDVNALSAPGTRALYRRAIAWCAGLPPS